MRYSLLLYIGILCTFGLIFLSQQRAGIYHRTLGKIYKTYQRAEGAEFPAYDYIPYASYNRETVKNWDAGHYIFLGENFYSSEEGRKYLFAFFPLFPLALKATGLDSLWIPLLNVAVFFTGILFLLRAFRFNDYRKDLLFTAVLATLSSFTIVYMPYADALAFTTGAAALYFLLQKKYPLFALFALLFATSRPNIMIVILAWITGEIIMAVLRRDRSSFTIGKSLLRLAPLAVGVCVVFTLYYWISGNFFVFFEAQAGWNTQPQFPKEIRDWSSESITLNVFLLFGIAPVLLLNYARKFILKLLGKSSYLFHKDPLTDHIISLSHIYFVGTGLYIFIFQGGNLHSAHRYLLVSPFFPFLLWYYFNMLSVLSSWKKTIICLLPVIAGPLMLLVAWKGKMQWEAATGLWLLLLLFPLLLFFDKILKHKPLVILYMMYFAACIAWQTLLYNQFLGNGWIWA